VPQDLAQATRLQEKACRLRDAAGCYNLGRAWLRGRNGDTNEAEGIELLLKACRLGDQDGCDEAPTAVAELRRKCEASPKSCNNLGYLMESGQGMAVDLDGAATQYRKACAAGDGVGCFNLGELQRDGKGMKRDLAAARASFALACKRAHDGGCREEQALKPGR
jgi:TPR repeat protein